MKKVTETKVIERSMFEAIDGTRFETQSECERYEKTALCVLNQKYKNYVVHHGSEYDIWHIGSEDYELDLVVVPTPEAIEHILQMYAYYEPRLSEQEYSNAKELIQSAYSSETTLIIDRGCKGDEYFYIQKFTMQDRINHLKKLGKCN